MLKSLVFLQALKSLQLLFANVEVYICFLQANVEKFIIYKIQFFNCLQMLSHSWLGKLKHCSQGVLNALVMRSILVQAENFL